MNFNLHFGELHSDNSINDKNNLFENYIPKCYKVKRILISFNCFSEYTLNQETREASNVCHELCKSSRNCFHFDWQVCYTAGLLF